MALLFHTPVDPTAADDVRDGDLASCHASRLLRRELESYCNSVLGGRSVLFAGLRGAGKTWLVEGAVKAVVQRSRFGHSAGRRPLVVRLLGPQIFEVLKDEVDPPGGAEPSKRDGAHDGPVNNTTVTVAVNPGPQPAPADPSGKDADDRWRRQQRRLFQHLLERVVLGLHAALAQELVHCFRQLAAEAGDARLHELAATLEITLPEGPSPATMRHFWRQVGALEGGVLFPGRRDRGAGMRELSALSGIGYAYKRVAGQLQEKHQETSSSTQAQADTAPGWDARLADVAKPVTAVLAGAGVTASTASADAVSAAVLGLGTSLLAGLLFRLTATHSSQDEEGRDLTFLPNTDAATLDRVLPELVKRLTSAGLAPVIIVDELDKVDDLWDKVLRFELLDHFKKLFAERVFTCLLVNRDYMERLRVHTVTQPYARFHSYFTQRAYVSFEPAELHAYLEHLIEPTRG